MQRRQRSWNVHALEEGKSVTSDPGRTAVLGIIFAVYVGLKRRKVFVWTPQMYVCHGFIPRLVMVLSSSLALGKA